MENKLVGQATPEQIEEWKKKHGAIYSVEVDGHVCYLKKPDRAAMAYASAALKEGPFQYAESIVDNCRIGGSDIFDKDDEYFLAVMQKAEELIEIKKAEIVKL